MHDPKYSAEMRAEARRIAKSAGDVILDGPTLPEGYLYPKRRKPKPNPISSGPARSVSVRAPAPRCGNFVDDVFAVARRIPYGDPRRYGRDKVFISAIGDALRIPLERVKMLLLMAHRAGKLELTRADLTSGMNKELVRRSETWRADRLGEYHFVYAPLGR